MLLWLFAALAAALFILGVIREPRSFWNAIALMLTLCIIFLAMSMESGILARLAALAIILLPLVFFGSAGFLIIDGFKILKKEGFSLSNTLSLLLGLFMIFGSCLSLVGLIHFQDASICRSLFYLVLSMECYLAFTFAALFLYSWLYTYMPKHIACDYIIIHGCGLQNGDRVTPLLKGRLDKAIEVYQHAGQRPKLVASGGAGGDEKISEAQAMQCYLLEQGIPETDILLEDKSTTTYENLRNVRDLLDTGGQKHRYIFVTNNYHVFRTGLFARRLHMNAQGIGCRTASYFWPSAFIREYIAILAAYKWVFAAIVLLWAAIETSVYFL